MASRKNNNKKSKDRLLSPKSSVNPKATLKRIKSSGVLHEKFGQKHNKNYWWYSEFY